jgi:uncharacterized membrane protein YkvA (DUF1232 family)
MKFPIYDWYRQTIRNPKYRWWIVVATIAYLILPIDLLPDFIPLVGQVDDVLIVTLLVSELSQILIDRVKTGRVSSTTPSTSGEPVDSNTTSIDVDAVSVDR